MLNHQTAVSERRERNPPQSHIATGASPDIPAHAAARSRLPVCVLRDTCAIEERTAWAPYGAGGVWRRRQIDEILQRHGMKSIDMERIPKLSLPRKLHLATSVMLRFGRRVSWSRISLASAVHSFAFYQHNLGRAGVTRTMIVEWATDPIPFAVLRNTGFKIVVCLMALGSLWRERPHPITGTYPRVFLSEVENLRLADAVFCISREEQWLLANLGVSARYLPYFPDSERERELLDEREQRVASLRNNEFLICATRGNTDTTQSFREQVDWIRALFPTGEVTFHVTGNATEEIRDIWNSPGFVFHGTCPPNAFIDLKRRCRAICIHSQKGLGAVTRVPDMLLAGLPVLATPAAARSFLDLNGVHVYNSAAELRDLITSSLDVPSAPRRPEQLENDFAEQLKRLTLG